MVDWRWTSKYNVLNANLIDEVQQFIMPIVLNDGINIFEKVTCDTAFKIIDTKLYSSGVVRYRYRKLIQ